MICDKWRILFYYQPIIHHKKNIANKAIRETKHTASSRSDHRQPRRSMCRCRWMNILMHQSIPPAPSTFPRADPRALTIFLPWMANSRGWGLLNCQIPRGGDGKRGQMPRPPSTLQHFSLIAQSNSAILSILMCDFLFQLTSSFVIALGF